MRFDAYFWAGVVAACVIGASTSSIFLARVGERTLVIVFAAIGVVGCLSVLMGAPIFAVYLANHGPSWIQSDEGGFALMFSTAVAVVVSVFGLIFTCCAATDRLSKLTELDCLKKGK